MQQYHQAADAHVVQQVRKGGEVAGDRVVQQHLLEIGQAPVQEQHGNLAEGKPDCREVEALQVFRNLLEGMAIRPTEACLSLPAKHPWHPRLPLEQRKPPSGHGSVVEELEDRVTTPDNPRAVHFWLPPRLLDDHRTRDNIEDGPEQPLGGRQSHSNTCCHHEVGVDRVAAVGLLLQARAHLLVHVRGHQPSPSESNHDQPTEQIVLYAAHVVPRALRTPAGG
mmetsp:Transcript_80000/g.216760  ORF Transcript_80000/g.216760 Transcript_80000/m.216760 type:complete len:223 (-) Transcript_80000:46-714(-)